MLLNQHFVRWRPLISVFWPPFRFLNYVDGMQMLKTHQLSQLNCYQVNWNDEFHTTKPILSKESADYFDKNSLVENSEKPQGMTCIALKEVTVNSKFLYSLINYYGFFVKKLYSSWCDLLNFSHFYNLLQTIIIKIEVKRKCNKTESKDSCIQKQSQNGSKKKGWNRNRIKMHLARYNVPSALSLLPKERELLLNLNARPHISFQLTGQFSYLRKSNSSRTTDNPAPPSSWWWPKDFPGALQLSLGPLALNCWWTICICHLVGCCKNLPRTVTVNAS